MTASTDTTDTQNRRDALAVLSLARTCGRGRLRLVALGLAVATVVVGSFLLPVPPAPTPLLGGFGDEVVRVLFALVGIAGVVLVIWQPGKDLLNVRAWASGQIPNRDLKRVLLPALNRIAAADDARTLIATDQVKAGVGRVLDAATRLIAGFRDDPEDVHRSQSVLARLLPSVLDIAETFPQLERRSTDAAALRASAESTSETLTVIAETFEKRDQDNLHDNYQRISVELATLHRLADVAAPTDRILQPK